MNRFLSFVVVFTPPVFVFLVGKSSIAYILNTGETTLWAFRLVDTLSGVDRLQTWPEKTFVFPLNHTFGYSPRIEGFVWWAF